MKTKQITSAGSNNATLVAGQPATIGTITVFNAGAALAYLKLYDFARVPVPGTDTPWMVVAVPITGTAVVSFPEESGPRTAAGLGVGMVTGAANSDNTAVAAGQLTMVMTYRSKQ